MLDIVSYKAAREKLEEQDDAQQAQWHHTRQLHVDDVKRLQHAMLASDVAFHHPPHRCGVRSNAKWMSDAVQAALANRRRLQSILGVRGDDIPQVNVVAL